jgi:hypothetical protein
MHARDQSRNSVASSSTLSYSNITTAEKSVHFAVALYIQRFLSQMLTRSAADRSSGASSFSAALSFIDDAEEVYKSDDFVQRGKVVWT